MNLAAGEYMVQADLAGYRIRTGPSYSVSLATNGCAEANIWMEVDRRVQGVVRDDADRPVADALVEMISTKPNLKKWEQATMMYSAPVEFTASKNDLLVLTLNKTTEEFLKLRRK